MKLQLSLIPLLLLADPFAHATTLGIDLSTYATP